MATYNPTKKVLIEIRQSLNPAVDYEVWEAKPGGKCIEKDADDGDIQYILMPDQFRKFKEEDKYIFSVPCNVLTNLFSYFH